MILVSEYSLVNDHWNKFRHNTTRCLFIIKYILSLILLNLIRIIKINYGFNS